MCRLHLFVLDSHLATLWESNCPFGFLLVVFSLRSSYLVFVFLSLWCLWWEVWDNCIDSRSLPSFLFSIKILFKHFITQFIPPSPRTRTASININNPLISNCLHTVSKTLFNTLDLLMLPLMLLCTGKSDSVRFLPILNAISYTVYLA